MRRVRILEQAAEEAIEAAVWYERERAGLGADFAQAVEIALDLLEDEIVPLTAFPGAAGLKGAKRLILKRFPYDIVVLESGGDDVTVVAIAHHSRRPGYWRERMRT